MTKTQPESKNTAVLSPAVSAHFKGRAVLLSGASGGLGQALVYLLLECKVRALYLTARNQKILAELAERAQQQGVLCRTQNADLCSPQGQELYLAFLQEAAEQGVEHFILTAGMAPQRSEDREESLEAIERTLTVNCTMQLKSLYLLLGLQHTKAPAEHHNSSAIPGAVRSIALVSSQSALYPIPSLPVYGAGKAALSYAVQALTDECAACGLKLTLIEPGFFSSPMGERFVGRKWFVLSPQAVAERILKAMAAGRRRAVFPSALALGIRLLYLLPRPIGRAALKFFAFDTAADPRK